MKTQAIVSAAVAVLITDAVYAAPPIEPPMLKPHIAAGTLPPMERRLPEQPSLVAFDRPGQTAGRYGGELRMLMNQPRDTRMMVVYGYARLVGYDPSWKLIPDLLERVDVEEGRRFTLTLRKGHKWSDGHPFTAEDFRFYWEDVANDPELAPGGLERFLLVDGKPPRFEVLAETAVRYSWDHPNPFFLPALAGARPEYIYRPAHYLRQFHRRYAPMEQIQKRIKEEGERNWTSLFSKKSQQYQNDNPDLPSLQPWILTTPPPTSRFVFSRNPFYHRIDANGRQLPYIDTVSMTIASPQLIPAKAAAGETDLQARGLSFENYTVLKQGETRSGYSVHLWQSARGSELVLLLNLNVTDPLWQALVRQPDFRRALSLAIDRHEINQIVYFGLAREGNDTVLPGSPLFKPEYETRWATTDVALANRLLDTLGLKRGESGYRHLSDGRELEMVVETAGESPLQVAILQLIRDMWKKAGIRLLVKPEQRDVLRNRVFSGLSLMSVWSGLENALANAEYPPHELAPTSQQQLYWPKWGQYYETQGRSGEPIALPEAAELGRLHGAWISASNTAERVAIWHQMLSIRADQVFTIGTVRGVPQPIVVSNRLRNVPKEGIYNWEPGAHFGIFHPDTFWFADAKELGETR